MSKIPVKREGRAEDPYGDLKGCEEGCLCGCRQSGCSCHDGRGVWVPPRTDPRITGK